MLDKSQRRAKCTVVYPRHAFKPEDWLRFIELRPFAEGWKDLGLTDEDQMHLQVMIMLNPKGNPVVKGTGGLRKMRFAPAGWKSGKSGAVRVGYVHLQGYGVILLAVAYSKDERDDLTPEQRRAIRSLIKRVEEEFETGVVR